MKNRILAHIPVILGIFLGAFCIAGAGQIAQSDLPKQLADANRTIAQQRLTIAQLRQQYDVCDHAIAQGEQRAAEQQLKAIQIAEEAAKNDSKKLDTKKP